MTFVTFAIFVDLASIADAIPRLLQVQNSIGIVANSSLPATVQVLFDNWEMEC